MITGVKNILDGRSLLLISEKLKVLDING